MTKDIIQSIPIIGIFLIYVIGMMIASQRTKKKYPDYHVIKDGVITVYISGLKGRGVSSVYTSRTFVKDGDKYALTENLRKGLRFFNKVMVGIILAWIPFTVLFIFIVYKTAIHPLTNREMLIAFAGSMLFITTMSGIAFWEVYGGYLSCLKYLKKHDV